MRTLRVTTIALFLSGFAQASQDLHEVNTSLGLASSQGEDEGHLKDSLAVYMSYYRRLFPWFQVGGELGGFFGGKFEGVRPASDPIDIDNDGIPDTYKFSSNTFGATLHLTPQIKVSYDFDMETITWQPYAVFGGGYYWVFLSKATPEFSGTSSNGQLAINSTGEAVANRSTYGGINYGAGLSAYLPNGWGIGGEIRFHQLLARSKTDIIYRTPSVHISKRF